MFLSIFSKYRKILFELSKFKNIVNFKILTIFVENISCMEEQLDYSVKISCQNDIETVKTLVYLYSVSLVIRKKQTNILREQLVHLTALYVKYGYSRKTRHMAMTVFGTTILTINCMNHELTKAKILVKNEDYSAERKNLNTELLLLQNIYKNNGGKPPMFLFQIKENEG